MNSYEIQACNELQIDCPGTIQGHGTLLAFDRVGKVIAAATNTNEFGLPPAEHLVDRNLSATLSEYEADMILDAIAARRFRQLSGFTVKINGTAYAASVHENKQQVCILEIERDSHPTHDLITDASSLVSELSHTTDVAHGLSAACQLLHDLTRFQRVMAYRFDEDFNGQVIAESKEPGLDPFLGLSYPSSDIPKPARRSLAAGGIRVVASSSAIPVHIYTNSTTTSASKLDLGGASLRGVAPIHVSYLRNMGIEASVSLAILNQSSGLWGLIICHNDRPAPLPPSQRRAASVVAKLVSNHVMLDEGRRSTAAFTNANSTAKSLLEAVNDHHESPIDAVVHKPYAISQIIPADGIVVTDGQSIQRNGSTPTDNEILVLRDWLVQRVEGSKVFSTPSLGNYFTTSGQLGTELAGLLSFPLDSNSTTFAMLFRKQNLRSIRWAGDPKKASARDAADLALHQPRESFDPWHETIRGFAHPWSEDEVAVATFLMHALRPAFERNTLRELTSS